MGAKSRARERKRATATVPEPAPNVGRRQAWRFGAGAEQRLSKNNFWGFAGEYIYGGTLDTNLQSDLPVVAGGRGNLVGSYNNGGVLYFSAYYNWKF